MPLDYRDAAHRHWEDAEHLFDGSRWANADHLYGLAAECALKAVMLRLGMRLHPSGRPEDPYAVHIDRLWSQFSVFASGRGGHRYAVHISGHSNPFWDWDIGQRYHHRSYCTRQRVEKHREGAEVARRALTKAILDGLDGKVP